MYKRKVLTQFFAVLMFFSFSLFNLAFKQFSIMPVYQNAGKNEVETDAGIIDYCVPLEVLKIEEDTRGYIVVSTYEKSFIKAPFASKISHIQKDGMRGVVIEKYGYKCYALGFDVLNVKDGEKVDSGDIVGSIMTDKLYIKVYKNDNRISLKTLRVIFNA
jgi:hypothetical protein